jgi:hypothetical protein
MDIEHHSKEADLGWGSQYYHVIPSIINKYGLKIIAEIGVAFGGHLEKIMSDTATEKAYAIDPYFLYESSTDSFSYQEINYTQADYDNLFKFASERLKKFGNKVDFLRESSTDASKKIDDNYLDLVFIDAEHTFDALRKDIEAWFPKVKNGGIVSGHDYNHGNFPDVKRLVDEWCEEKNYDLNIGEGYVWWVIKK